MVPANPSTPLKKKNDLLLKAENIQVEKDQTEWDDLKSYSNRQKRLTPLGGFVGKITFTGDLELFREILAWGELLHVGKSVVKGNGWYRIEAA